MNIIRQIIAGTVALCAFASPAFAEVCMIGVAQDTLATWLRQTGQVPLINMNVTISDTESLQAMIAVAPDGSWTLLYVNKGSTCVMAVGKGAMPAGAPAEPAEPVKPERAL